MLCPKSKFTYKKWGLFVCIRIYLSSFAVRPGQNGLRFSHPCLHHVCGWYHVLRRLASQKTFIWHSNVTAKRGTPEFFIVGFFSYVLNYSTCASEILNLPGITQLFIIFLLARTWTFFINWCRSTASNYNFLRKSTIRACLTVAGLLLSDQLSLLLSSAGLRRLAVDNKVVPHLKVPSLRFHIFVFEGQLERASCFVCNYYLVPCFRFLYINVFSIKLLCICFGKTKLILWSQVSVCVCFKLVFWRFMEFPIFARHVQKSQNATFKSMSTHNTNTEASSNPVCFIFLFFCQILNNH